MNSELQAQTDVLVKAIKDATTTLHQDSLLLCFVLGALLTALIFVVLFKRQ